MTRILAILLVLAAVGCKPAVVVSERVTADPVPVTCSALCTSSCLPELLPDGKRDWPQWTGDPTVPSAWDNVYPDVANPLKKIARDCDAARDACVKCIGRIERAAVICGVTERCASGAQP